MFLTHHNINFIFGFLIRRALFEFFSSLLFSFSYNANERPWTSWHLMISILLIKFSQNGSKFHHTHFYLSKWIYRLFFKDIVRRKKKLAHLECICETFFIFIFFRVCVNVMWWRRKYIDKREKFNDHFAILIVLNLEIE